MLLKHDKKSFVAISAIWYERFLECSRTQGTEEFPNSVWRFYHSLLNLGENELAIKDQVKKYINENWSIHLDTYIQDTINKEHINSNDYQEIVRIENNCKKQMMVNLFEFIIQTIQDSGVGWPNIKIGDTEAWDYDDAIQKDGDNY